MEFINFILQLDISTKIALAALIMSIFSFYNSLRANLSKSALDCAAKKTETSIKLVETTLIFKYLLRLLNKMEPTNETCKNEVMELKKDLSDQINDCEKLKKNIENAPFFIGATILEKYSRRAQELYLNSETLVPRVEGISTECIQSHKKAIEHFNSIPESERPEFSCNIHTKKHPNKLINRTENTSAQI